MNADDLMRLYERVADAPGAVVRLRRFMLELAVRGKLAVQIPSEEPAIALIARMAAEKSASRDRRSLKNDGSLTATPKEATHLPPGWMWTQIGEIGRVFGGDSVSDTKKVELSRVATGDPFIATKDIGYGRDPIDYENGLRVPFSDTTYKRARPGSVLICAEGGSAGKKIGLVDRVVCFGNKLYATEVWTGVDPAYIFYLFQSESFYREFAKRMTGVIGGIAKSEFVEIPVPLPPSSEQRRIVAKIDELMALCDRLEAARAEREAARDRLTAASLARLNTPDPETFPGDAHFVLDALPALVAGPEQVKHLRQTILNLAIAGKLVEQVPGDEPAGQLLRRVQGDKSPAAAPQRSASTVDRLPAGWVIVELSEIAHVGTGLTPSRARPDYFDPPVIPWVTSGETGAPFISATAQHVSPTALKETSLKLYPAGTLLVAMYGQGKTRGQVTELLIDATTNQACAAIVLKLPDPAHRRYIKLYFEKMYDEIRQLSAGGAQPNLNVGKIKSAAIPLPPLAEQSRIVAKVDELMALCNQLEAALTAREGHRRDLLESLIHEALEPGCMVEEVA